MRRVPAMECVRHESPVDKPGRGCKTTTDSSPSSCAGADSAAAGGEASGCAIADRATADATEWTARSAALPDMRGAARAHANASPPSDGKVVAERGAAERARPPGGDDDGSFDYGSGARLHSIGLAGSHLSSSHLSSFEALDAHNQLSLRAGQHGWR